MADSYLESAETVHRILDEKDKERGEYSGPRGAGFFIRALARLIDAILGYLVGFLAAMLAVIFAYLSDSQQGIDSLIQKMEHLTLVGLLFSFIGVVAYHSISEFCGASLGKVICRLRVVDTVTRRASVKGVLVRNLVFPLDGLFLGLVAAIAMEKSPAQQRLGDKWGGTLVVRKKEIDTQFSTARITLGILGGVALWTALATIGFLVR